MADKKNSIKIKADKSKNSKLNAAALAELERRRNEKRIIGTETPFEVIEAYKALRTNIMFSLSKEKGCRTLVITSATSGEGKTTTSINIAISFAQTGAKVLLVDCDLRAPRVHKYLKITHEKGLSNVLAGFDKLDDCIVKTEQENLDCVVSGPVPPNPVELISSEAMKEFASSVEGKYDYVIFDTPPINIVTEAALLSKLATGVIMVARQKYTMFKMVERALNSLAFAEANVIGFILNDAIDDKYMYGTYRSSRGYGRYGRYGRYGKYGKYGYKSSYRYSESFEKAREASLREKENKPDGEKK